MDFRLIASLLHKISGSAYGGEKHLPHGWTTPLSGDIGFTPIGLVANILGLPKDTVEEELTSFMLDDVVITNRLLNIIAGTDTWFPEGHESWKQPLEGTSFIPWMLVSNMRNLDLDVATTPKRTPPKRKPPRKLQKTSTLEEILLAVAPYLVRISWINASSMMDILILFGLSVPHSSTAGRYLKVLTEEGYLIRKGPSRGPTVHWVVTEKLSSLADKLPPPDPEKLSKIRVFRKPPPPPLRPSKDLDRKALEFLKEFLKDGPRTSGQVRRAAKDIGLSERLIYSAAKLIGVKKKREGRSQWWSLPLAKPEQKFLPVLYDPHRNKPRPPLPDPRSVLGHGKLPPWLEAIINKSRKKPKHHSANRPDQASPSRPKLLPTKLVRSTPQPPASVPLSASEESRAPSKFSTVIGGYQIEIPGRFVRRFYGQLRFAAVFTGKPLAGSFSRWATVHEMFRDPNFVGELLDALDNNDFPYGDPSRGSHILQLRIGGISGWADAVPESWVPNSIPLDVKDIKVGSRETILEFIADPDVPGPATHVITVGIAKRGRRVRINKLYPGPFVGYFEAQDIPGSGFVFLEKKFIPPGDVTDGSGPSFWDIARAEKEKESQETDAEHLRSVAALVEAVLELSDEALTPSEIALPLAREGEHIPIEDIEQALALIPVSEHNGRFYLENRPATPPPTVELEPEPEPKPELEPELTPVDILESPFVASVSDEIYPLETLPYTINQPFVDRNDNLVTSVQVDGKRLNFVIQKDLKNFANQNRFNRSNSAGSFLQYHSILDAFSRDNNLWSLLLSRLRKELNKFIRKSKRSQEIHFTLNHPNLIGWSDNVSKFFAEKLRLETRRLDLSGRVYPLPIIHKGQYVGSVVDIPAPLTNKIAIHGGMRVGKYEDEYIFFLHDIYPGPDLGDLKEQPFDIDHRYRYLFPLHGEGESIFHLETTRKLVSLTQDLQKELLKTWVTDLRNVKAEDYAHSIGIPIQQFDNEILRPIGLTVGHKNIKTGVRGRSRSTSSDPSYTKASKDARKILLIGGLSKKTDTGEKILRAMQSHVEFLDSTYQWKILSVYRDEKIDMKRLPDPSWPDLVIVFTAYTKHLPEVMAKYAGTHIISASKDGHALKSITQAAESAKTRGPQWFYEDWVNYRREKGFPVSSRRNPLRRWDRRQGLTSRRSILKRL